MFAISLLVTILYPASLGTFAFARLSPFPSRMGTVAAGTTLGIVLFSWLNFLTAQSAGITWASVALATFLFTLITWLFHRHSPLPSKVGAEPVHPTILLALGMLCFLMVLIFSKIYASQADGLHTHKWLGGSDLSTHLSIISSFAFGPKMLPDNPYFSGAPLRYPYLPNFYAALLWFSSGNMEWAVKAPEIIFALICTVLIFEWTLQLTNSGVAAFLAPILFLFNGSLGWIYGLKHYATQNWDQHIYLVNHIQSLLNQRALIVGLPLFLITLTLWQKHTQQFHQKKLYLTAMIAGLLPMVHAHSMLCLFFFLVALAITSARKAVLGPLMLIGLLWLPQVLFLSGAFSAEAISTDTLAQPIFKFHPGWMTQGNFFWFWLKNTSLWIPMGVVAWLATQKNRNLQMLHLTAWIIFFLANLFDFAPYSWDNTKLFFYWMLALTPAMALWLASLKGKYLWLIPTLLLIINLTGFMDVGRFLLTKPDFMFFDAEDLTLGKWFREHTPKESIVVHFPRRNNPLIVSGRRSFLGATNMEMFGLQSKERFVKSMLMGRGKEEAKPLMAAYHISHFLLGPEERNLGFNETFMKETSDLVFETSNVKVFRVKNPE